MCNTLAWKMYNIKFCEHDLLTECAASCLEIGSCWPDRDVEW